MPLHNQMKIHLPVFIQKYFSRIPHRVLVYTLATGVMIFSAIQRFTFYMCLEDMVDMTSLDYSISNCTFITTSSRQDLTERKSLFKWSNSEILGMVQFFAIGKLVAIIPAGIAVGVYGAKPILLFGFLLSCVTTLLFPHMAVTGSHELQAGRMVQGIGQGALYSSLAAIIAHWAPISERNTFGSIIQSGTAFGYYLSVITFRIIPLLEGNWEVKFYLAGGFGVLWFIVCWYFLCSRPSICAHISLEERMLIYSQTQSIDRLEDQRYPVPVLFPWSKMFSSIPLLSLILYCLGLNFLHHLMKYKFHSYSLNVLHLDLPLTNMVYYILILSGTSSTILFGITSDLFINRNYMSREAIMKMFVGLGTALTVPLIVGVMMLGCDVTAVVVLITALYYVQGLLYYNLPVLPIDISPQYAAGVSAVVNFVCELFILLSEAFFRIYLKQRSKLDPMLLGYFSAALVGVCTLQFLWLGSTEVQPWNYDYLTNSPYRRRRSHSLQAIAELLAPRQIVP